MKRGSEIEGRTGGGGGGGSGNTWFSWGLEDVVNNQDSAGMEGWGCGRNDVGEESSGNRWDSASLSLKMVFTK